MSYSVVPCESGSGAPSQMTESSSSSSIGPKSAECEQIFFKLQVQKERTQIDEKTQLFRSRDYKKNSKEPKSPFQGSQNESPRNKRSSLSCLILFLKFRKTKTPPPYRNFGIITSGLTEL